MNEASNKHFMAESAPLFPFQYTIGYPASTRIISDAKDQRIAELETVCAKLVNLNERIIAAATESSDNREQVIADLTKEVLKIPALESKIARAISALRQWKDVDAMAILEAKDE